jgi:hypothetical protein
VFAPNEVLAAGVVDAAGFVGVAATLPTTRGETKPFRGPLLAEFATGASRNAGVTFKIAGETGNDSEESRLLLFPLTSSSEYPEAGAADED